MCHIIKTTFLWLIIIIILSALSYVPIYMSSATQTQNTHFYWHECKDNNLYKLQTIHTGEIHRTITMKVHEIIIST